MNGEQRVPGTVEPATAALRLAAALLGRPARVARRGGDLVVELGRIGLGTSPFVPATGHPLRRRAVAVHAATVATATALLDDATLPRADDRLLRGLLGTVAAVLDPGPRAPDVGPAAGGAAPEPAAPRTGPAAARAGGSAADGSPAAPSAGSDNPGPDAGGSSTAPDAPEPARARPLRVGEELAATPGAVVLRTETFELIHYLPQTVQVRAVPVLVVAPPTARFYLADLAPGRSIVEHLVRAGQQVLAVSWRNPGPEHAGWDLDTYGRAVLDAVDACSRIARVPAVALLGVGDGGRLAALVLGHLAATGRQDLVACAAFAAADPPAELDRQPADVRAWASDVVRAPDGLRTALAAASPTTRVRLLGSPVDPAAVDRDSYVVTTAGARSGRWPGGASRIVTVAGGDAGSLVAPPGMPDAEFVAAPGADAGQAAGGSWWTDLTAWLDRRTGALCEAPAELGGRRMPAVAPAPGEYVLAR